jgi:Flp pilus assembly pilin Flp
MRRRFARDAEAGQGLAEYALIIAFVALVCVAALGVLGQAIANSPGFALF